MKKCKIIASLIATCLVFVISGATFYAWLSNQDRTEEIDISTNGIVISYDIEGEETNTESISVKNLAFFDIDNPNEGTFFSRLAVHFEIKISNKSGKAIALQIGQEGLTDDAKEKPYVMCVFSKDELNTANNDKKTVLECLALANAGSMINDTLAPDDTDIIYHCYIIGVIPDDGSSNEPIESDDNGTLSSKVKYSFRININARKGA